MGKHYTAPLRWLTLGWSLILLQLVMAGDALAYNQWEWKYGSTTYPTKEQALAAMRAALPQNTVLTVELPPDQMGYNTVRYRYVAPPKTVTYGTIQYNAYCDGWSGSCSYPSEGAAAAGLADGPYYQQCGPGAASPTSDWILTQGPPSLSYIRHYQAQSSGYSQSLGCSGTLTLSTAITSVQSLSCPAYYSVTTTPPYTCQNSTSDYITGHPLECPCGLAVPGTSTEVGNPIDVATADKKQIETDYSGPALSFIRYYHSQTLESFHGLGAGWTDNFSAHLILLSNTPQGLVRPDGSHDPIAQIGAEYISESGASIHVQSSGSNWIAYLSDGSHEVYNSSGYLIQLVNPAGQVTTLAYNTDGTLASVVGPFGHTLLLSYTNGLLSQLTDPSGQVLTYTYDANYNLASVMYPDGTVRSYEYEVPSLVNHLTGVTDEAGIRYATFGYDSIGRASSSQHAGGADAVSVTYGTGSATVVDGLGGTTVFTFGNLSNYSPRVTSISHNGTTRNYVVPSAYLTDIQQRDTQMTDENGNVSSYSYDSDHLTSTTQASGTSVARTYTYSYLSPLTALPTLVNEPLKKTTYGYYSGTNLAQTKTITDLATGLSRSWNYTYDGYGRVLTADGPRTDVSDLTTYTYYTCTTGYQCGQLQTITNAVGQVTTFNTYNAHGQPRTITDPNGVLTTLSYDLRQRLISRQVGTETTTFSYWPTGLLKQVTLPDASYVLYTYDNAHRLTQVSDSLGNKIVYTLDPMGNRTAENTYDPSGTLHRTHTRVFNTLNELYQDVNAAGTASVTTTFGYDFNGNQTSVAAPLSRNSATTYDPLNRVKQITDPGNGITKFTYDSNDNLTSVTDPRNLLTSYSYNGFGDLASLTSPDTGGTSNTYDSAGNLATATDARGAVSTYSYDALNRVSSVQYALGGTTDQTITFGYDSGTNGAGHLTGASDANHSLSWGYDTLGRVVSKSQTVNGVTKTVTYAFTSGDLTTLTTPSGQTVTYGYNTNHQVTSVAVNGTTILSNVTYEPLGPVNGWTWGNGTATARSYMGDGTISQISSNGVRTYSYDDALRITGISDTSTGSSNWTYGYDALDRLTSGTSGTITRGWSYDANGNRLTESGSSPSTYSISTTSNRVASITGALARTYGYDAAGHTTSYSSATATYNDAGRLSTVSTGSAIETLVYNALGQRIGTSGGTAGTVLYWYDEQGHLLGEYDGSGNLIEETVWFGDLPVATLQPSGSGIAIYYVHTDQLSTPRQITRPADNAQVWTWFSDPFGTDAANSNPTGVGSFSYNLRFPGQVFDGQVGLHLNYFRDFDPATGRYIESDPIGLLGGINPYSYVRANPLSHIDPAGLATAVAVGGPIGSNPFGHAAVATTGEGVYSYGTSDPFGSSFSQYLENQSSYRDTVVFVLDTTPDQEKKIIAAMNAARHSKYGVVSNNCATTIQNALFDAGVGLNYSTDPNAAPLFLPTSLVGLMLSMPGTAVYSIPQGGPIPSALNQFNHSN